MVAFAETGEGAASDLAMSFANGVELHAAQLISASAVIDFTNIKSLPSFDGRLAQIVRRERDLEINSIPEPVGHRVHSTHRPVRNPELAREFPGHLEDASHV